MHKVHNANLLLSFLTISECGSINQAARMLNISQSALTRTIRQFEERIGKPLFTRSAKGVVLTGLGRDILGEAQVVRAAVQQVEAHIARAEVTQRHHFHIAVGLLQPLPILARALLDVIETMPNVDFQVSVLNDPQAWLLLEQGKADMIVTARTMNPGLRPLVEDPLFYNDPGIYCSVNHRLAQVKHVQLEELLKEKWVLGGPGTGAMVQVAKVFRSHGLDLPIIHLEVDEPAMRLGIVALSDYLSAFEANTVLTNPANPLAKINCEWPLEKLSVGAIRLLPHTPLSLKLVEALHRRLAETKVRIPVNA